MQWTWRHNWFRWQLIVRLHNFQFSHYLDTTTTSASAKTADTRHRYQNFHCSRIMPGWTLEVYLQIVFLANEHISSKLGYKISLSNWGLMSRYFTLSHDHPDLIWELKTAARNFAKRTLHTSVCQCHDIMTACRDSRVRPTYCSFICCI